MNVIRSVFFTVFILVSNEVHANKKLNVEILFESLCPDSLRFIGQQLYPNWPDIAEFVNLKLVPFGKSKSLENGKQFICQHGPAECKGNRIMSCALNRIPDQTLQVEYVNCFMNHYRREKHDSNAFGQQCAARVGLRLNEITDCYSSEEGTLHQLNAEESTNFARTLPNFIPTVLYNGEFNQELQDLSQHDFRGVVCSLIQKTFPDSCQTRSVISI